MAMSPATCSAACAHEGVGERREVRVLLVEDALGGQRVAELDERAVAGRRRSPSGNDGSVGRARVGSTRALAIGVDPSERTGTSRSVAAAATGRRVTGPLGASRAGAPEEVVVDLLGVEQVADLGDPGVAPEPVHLLVEADAGA